MLAVAVNSDRFLPPTNVRVGHFARYHVLHHPLTSTVLACLTLEATVMTRDRRRNGHSVLVCDLGWDISLSGGFSHHSGWGSGLGLGVP